MTAAEFIAKWRNVELTERAAAQSHFNDLCGVLGHPQPIDVDKTGDTFTFERGAAKHGGGDGWADVWKKDFFGWEYKGKHKDLAAAYDQLLLYREDLENPPLLVVCDMDRLIVHTNFTNTKPLTFEIPLAALDAPRNLEILRAVFHDPAKLKPGEPSRAITEHAAAQLGELAGMMGKRGLEPHAVAHYLIRLVFCLFAEDVDLLPRGLFAEIVNKGRNDPPRFSRMVAQLFGAMANGGEFGADIIKHFNGNLFADATVLDLTRDEIERVAGAAALEWNTVDASIFGTLFTRGIDPQQRSQLGAQYTGRADIETIVEPVIMTPLRREWADVRGKADALLATDAKKNRAAAEKLLTAFLERLKRLRVLDSAGGSGNFLYVTLQKILDLEKEVNDYLGAHSFTPYFPGVNPGQLYLIEINTYAHSLAQVTVQIGYIQWLRAHGYGSPKEPILLQLDKNFLQADALFTDWPDVDFIISNPPFLGSAFQRRELTDAYVDRLHAKFSDRVPKTADYCCYWFEKARELIADGKCQRAGLLATQGIRGGANREVLKRIKATGDIFFAVSDRDWILDGANVHISMIGFDNGSDQTRTLDGQPVPTINANLTAAGDLTQAMALPENANFCFRPVEKGGSFEISKETAADMLRKQNPNGKSNADVLRRWTNADMMLKNPKEVWIIDFAGLEDETAVAQFEAPFEYLKEHVQQERQQNRDERLRKFWWMHRRSGEDMREGVKGLSRMICTPRVSKHRLFLWLPSDWLPDTSTYVFARDDDYFFGVLHSRAHEVWALKLGTRLETRPRYTPTTCFETFPFPWPPRTPLDALTVEQRRHVDAIAAAAKELTDQRNNVLSDPNGDAKTLTALYNKLAAGKATWLANAHAKLDAAVCAAYGWPVTLTDDEILERLLKLNHDRAAGQTSGAATKPG